MNIQTMVVEIVVAIAVAIITRYIVPWIKAHTSLEQQKAFNGAIDIFVAAAEQVFGGQNGKQKMEAVKEWLSTRGIDADEVDIESAVYRLRHTWADVPEYAELIEGLASVTPETADTISE
ncbi:hypothetical protein AGMMS49992_25720 [Clostridia bacterium]|nr:hypothetical protein AGMMS49992_25720 [Clostridia bacterium]